MKQGICPKCTARDIYRHAGSRFSNEAITLKGDFFSKGASPDKYICATCGYLEYYLPTENNDNIQLVRDNWERVPAK